MFLFLNLDINFWDICLVCVNIKNNININININLYISFDEIFTSFLLG